MEAKRRADERDVEGWAGWHTGPSPPWSPACGCPVLAALGAGTKKLRVLDDHRLNAALARLDRRAVWLRIMRAVEELLAKERPEGALKGHRFRLLV